MAEKSYTCKESDKHYFLYAKYWYMRNNLWYDLAIIQSEAFLLDFKYITTREIANHLLKIAIDIQIKTQNSSNSWLRDHICRFISELHPDEFWKINEDKGSYNIDEAITKRSLSLIANTIVDNLNPDEDCDFNILPKKGKEREWVSAKH